ncbi:TfoX/Sxy family protein [Oscillospiraceae bacterium PP1C4]
MASSIDYVLYACEQMRLAGMITYKKMFGEYAIYCDGKCFALICDNQLFINPTKAGLSLMPNAAMGIPYEGAKPRILLEDVDDTEFLSRLVRDTCAELPMPKPKKKRSVNQYDEKS